MLLCSCFLIVTKSFRHLLPPIYTVIKVGNEAIVYTMYDAIFVIVLYGS